MRIACDVIADASTADPRGSTEADSALLLAGRVIHIVEDSLAIAGVIRLLLEHAGAEVRHSPDGLQGVDHILEARDEDALPDLVIMDMQMPNKDGYTAAAELREEGIGVPIIAMTAAAFTDDRDKCLDAGCNAYFSKPIDPARFVHQISEYLT